MQVIGFNFEKIKAERKKDIKGNLEIKSNIELKEVTQEKLELVKDKDVIKFSFLFSVNYKPDFADIILEGFVLVILEKEKIKEVLKRWKDKKVPDDIRLPLFNLILTKCNLKALQFEEEFGLPTHIPMPRLQAGQQSNNRDYVR